MTLLLKGPFDGSSTIKGYEHWTPIDSLQWGATRGVSTPTSEGADRSAGRMSVSEVTITKALDQSTAAMALLLGTGTGVEIKIVVLQSASAGTTHAELTIVLGNALATGFSTSSGGDRPSESYSFTFDTLSATMAGLDASGAVVDLGSYTYDVIQGRAS